MLKTNLSKRARNFLKKLPPKQARQLARKIYELSQDPNPPDTQFLKGNNKKYLRADVGEYRIIYQVISDSLVIALVGKRNDDEVYRQLKQLALHEDKPTHYHTS